MNTEDAGFFDKVVFISGGGSGIGRATCQLFAARGAWVAVADHDMIAGEETVALITNDGGKAEFFEVDVSIEASMRQAVDAVVAR